MQRSMVKKLLYLYLKRSNIEKKNCSTQISNILCRPIWSKNVLNEVGLDIALRFLLHVGPVCGLLK